MRVDVLLDIWTHVLAAGVGGIGRNNRVPLFEQLAEADHLLGVEGADLDAYEVAVPLECAQLGRRRATGAHGADEEHGAGEDQRHQDGRE